MQPRLTGADVYNICNKRSGKWRGDVKLCWCLASNQAVCKNKEDTKNKLQLTKRVSLGSRYEENYDTLSGKYFNTEMNE